ncbi:SH3 domain-containing protein [Mesorhizobium sp. B2-5-13]|uniref:SH3 domain-containing protein n=1 Tax=unclassified Mesorhizobium TaxID=325217 RepID=UPI001125B804|nr:MULTISPECIES: SH3 domain-containing protein [unclassified Mesorhizobium]TPJ42545.1 SH3 domain-containing protein [Mesorhizobium sp. B2-6-5]TPJ93520.1 SH3 domain-containing protein [Mesorhizobium sp. B2-5-13]TPK48564.1 SH3 domain-containing protein [Mesorhizobium sp. B2-5-5]TPM03159.1 SH3 domain-containing protein [Mesorhizobium sp. B2-3-11]
MSFRALLSAAALMAVVGFWLGASTPTVAQYCEGTVHGLSGRYNLATGSGFLAVRTRPNSSSQMIGQLFNGDHTEIFDRRGNWYQVEIGGGTGWANARWLRNNCGY